MADIKNSFLELPDFLTQTQAENSSLLASCIIDSGCVDSLDCQSDGSSCSRDGCTDCSDCNDSLVETSITLVSLTSSYDSVTAQCNVTVRYATSSLYVVLRLNGSLTAQSSTFSLSAGGSRAVTISKSGLQPNTYYSVEVILYNASGQVVKDTGGISTTIQPPTEYGSMNIIATSLTSITVNLRSISNATSYLIAYRPSTATAQTEIETGATTYTITGLTPNTLYYLNYRGKNAGGIGPYMPTSASAKTINSVLAWDWNKSNGAASAQQTQQAYQAITQSGYLSNFKYTVWNDMVDKTVQIIDARGVTWNSDYGTVASTKMTASDTEMTAQRFNAIWWNLSHFVTVSGAKKALVGDIIYGSYFIALTNAMNKSIPTLEAV